jgi:hypothetical protein
LNLVQDVGGIGVVFRFTSANYYILGKRAHLAPNMLKPLGFFSRQNTVLDVGMTPGIFWPVDMNPKKVFC